MNWQHEVRAALAASVTPLWLGEIAERVGVSFARMENLRSAVNALVTRGEAVRVPVNGSARVYYSLSPKPE